MGKFFIFFVVLGHCIFMGCSAESGDTASQGRVPAETVSQLSSAERVPAKDMSKANVFILENGDYFIYERRNADTLIARLVSTLPVNAEEQFERIVWMLKKTEASEAFIELVSTRLSKNRRLKQASFTLLLTDKNGEKHEFLYSSDTKNGFYSLIYRYSRESV